MATTVNKVPAKYIGHHTVTLMKGQGPFFNSDGTQRTSLTLNTGDVLMMPDREVLGYTLLHDPRGQRDPLDLGVGKVVLPEHQGFDEATLAVLGYEWHQGSPIFEAVNAQQQTATPQPQEQQQTSIDTGISGYGG